MQPLGGTDSNNVSTPLLIDSPGRLLSSNVSPELENVFKWITALNSTETRETALLELCKKRESVTELAPLLWNSCGAIAALLQEICAIYPFLYPPRLTATQSNRVCNALALLQCLASHTETRSDFLKANIPLYLYTFLNTNNHNRPFEYLRLTSLGVIGALVKMDEPEVIAFLLSSEIIPLCLIIMESGTELSKTVATFIMQKMLLDTYGLAYICQTYQRFAHVATVLEKMVHQLTHEPSLRLLKHVVRCYLRLSDHPRARDTLRSCLPQQLTDETFVGLLDQDVTTKRWLTQLLRNLALMPAAGPAAGVSTTPSVSVTTNPTGTGIGALSGAATRQGNPVHGGGGGAASTVSGGVGTGGPTSVNSAKLPDTGLNSEPVGSSGATSAAGAPRGGVINQAAIRSGSASTK